MSDPDLLDEADGSAREAGALLSGASVRGLYGRYNYEIPIPLELLEQRLVLFYGENGSGKTTVLRLIWHLLSAAKNRRHRSSIAKVTFQELSIYLANGDQIRARRPEAVAGPYVLEVHKADGTTLQSDWPSSSNPFSDWPLAALMERRHRDLPQEMIMQADAELQRRLYIAYLEELEVRPYFLADDRIIYSDELDEATLRRREVTANRRFTIEGAAATTPDDAQGAVVQELETSLRRASEYLRELTLGGNASGSAGANSVYLDVLQRLGHRSDDADQERADVRSELIEQISKLGQRSRHFEDFQLVPRFESPAFINAVQNLYAPDRINAARDMLSPYLNSLSARLDALQDAESLVRTFIAETNGFLRDKSLTFTPRAGLRIRLETLEPLDVQQLSSGERQLVLLLCNALLARRGTRLFLIDEPELSLNVKWQRRILEALLACTSGTPVQFLVATHSLELLAGYRPNVVRFEEKGN